MLRIKIQHSGTEIPTNISVQVKAALLHALDRFPHVVREVEMSLRDLNGPKGGIDKQCTLQVRLYPRGLAVVKSSGTSFIEAVHIACDKIQQIVAKRIGRAKGGEGRSSILRSKERAENESLDGSPS